MTTSSQNTLRKKVFLSLRVVFTVILLARVFYIIDWQSIQIALPKIQMYWLILTLCFLWLSNALSGLRWGFIMRSGGFSYPYLEYVRWYFSGGLINQGLPTTIGGDSYRAISAFDAIIGSSLNSLQSQPNRKSAFFNVALDRSMGFAGNSILGAIGLGLGGAVFNDWLSELGWALCIAMLLGAVFITCLIYWPVSRKMYQMTISKLDIKNAYSSTISVWGWPQIIIQIPLAVGIHFLTLAAFWGCLKACQINAPIESLLIGIPALGILMILPISISGWGLRETSLAGILGFWGLDSTLVILSSLLYGLMTFVAFLPGLLRLIIKNRPNLR